MKLLLILVLYFSLALDCFSSPINPPGVQNLDLSLVSNILKRTPAVEVSCDLSFEQKNLEYLSSTLQIPSAPRLLETQSTMVKLQSIADGLELHRHLLQDIKEKLKCSGDIAQLLADISDLMQEMERLTGVSPSDTQPSSFSLAEMLGDDEYRLKLAVHLILEQLRPFTHYTWRTLRQIKNTRI